jgi:hypothetical protein
MGYGAEHAEIHDEKWAVRQGSVPSISHFFGNSSWCIHVQE